MLDMMKRHEIQVLRRAGHSQLEVARLAGTSERTVRRVEEEPAVISVEPGEAERRGIGRPSKAAVFRPFVMNALAAEPDVLSLEVLRRARLEGYEGGKSALYALIAALRPAQPARISGITPAEFPEPTDVGGRPSGVARVAVPARSRRSCVVRLTGTRGTHFRTMPRAAGHDVAEGSRRRPGSASCLPLALIPE